MTAWRAVNGTIEGIETGEKSIVVRRHTRFVPDGPSVHTRCSMVEHRFWSLRYGFESRRDLTIRSSDLRERGVPRDGV